MEDVLSKEKRIKIDSKNLHIIKYGDDSLMIWSCMNAQGVRNLHFIDKIMNQDIYLNILKTSCSQC